MKGAHVKEETASHPDNVDARDGPGVMRELLYLLLKIVAIAAAFLLIFTFLFGIYRNGDVSMFPSVKDGDLVLFYRLDKAYVKSDAVVLKYKGETMTRRVIAIAGDTVDITDEGLFINGSLQIEHDIYEKTERFNTGVEFPLKVGEGQVFVLGDARKNATDSRVFGCVNISDTLGKVTAVIRRRGI